MTLRQLFLKFRSISPLLVFILVFLFFSFFSPGHKFTSIKNIRNILVFGSEFSILVLGVGLLMISAEFDLSVGSIIAFCSFIFVFFFEQGISPLWGTLIVVVIGACIGFINGVITTKGGIPSFLTTLGGMMFWRGFTLLISKGGSRPFYPERFPVFSNIMAGRIGGFLPTQALWFVALAAVLTLLLHFHRFGNWIFSTGGNKEAAKAMGINTDRVKIVCFMIVGVLCALVAVMIVVRTSGFSSRIAEGWELMAIAASVVGGVALWGGTGSMAGIILGALTISVIKNGLVTLRISYSWTYIVFGVVIISSVLVHRYVDKKRVSIRVNSDSPTKNNNHQA